MSSCNRDVRSRRAPPERRILEARLLETARAQAAAVAAPAGGAVGPRIVAAVRQPVVQTERCPATDDLRLREAQERREHAQPPALDARLRRQRSHALEGLEILGPAVRIA